MKRRRWLAAMAGAASWAASARGQQVSRARRVGLLLGRTPDDPDGPAYVDAFRRQLAQLGWTLGQNLEVEIRWLARDANEAVALAGELAALRPDVLVVNSSLYLRAVRQAARGIPVVFVAIADPVGQGFVTSLARPGGDMTGFGVEE